jgi:hypothetical protein
MTLLKMLTADDKLAEIKRLYFKTSAHTINDDFAKAVDLLKTMGNDEERERAAVFMEGLAEMRADWARRDKMKKKKHKRKKTPRPEER